MKNGAEIESKQEIAAARPMPSSVYFDSDAAITLALDWHRDLRIVKATKNKN